MSDFIEYGSDFVNYRVIDVENGSEPTEHATLIDAIKAGRKLSGAWFIEDLDGAVVWAWSNER